MVNYTELKKDHEKKIERKTYTVKELATVLGIGENKARQLTHAKGFPIIVFGVKRLTIISRLDEWIENNIGEIFEC